MSYPNDMTSNIVAEPVTDRASEDTMLTKSELAARLKKSKRTIDHWVALKRIPMIKVSARASLFHWPDVVARLNQFRVS